MSQISQIIYYLIDLETSGLNLKTNETTQVSIIRCSDRHQLTKYIKAEHPETASDEALRITKRTRADLLKGDAKEFVVDACDRFFAEDGATPEHRCMVGHNVHRFDQRFTHDLWRKCGKQFGAHLWLDTLPFTKAYARKFGIESPSFNLASSLNILKVASKGEAHNALTDSQNNYRLWRKLMESGVDHLDHIKRIPHLLNNTEDDE